MFDEEENIFRFMTPQIPPEISMYYSHEYEDACKLYNQGKAINNERAEMLEELEVRKGRLIYDRKFFKY